MAGYIIKIALENCRPPVWRNVVIPENITFGTLHEIIQNIYGWNDMHLHEFVTDDKSTSIVSEDDELEEIYSDFIYSEENTRVNEFLENHKWIRYTYDFGSEWRHKITLQKKDSSYRDLFAQVLKYKGDNFVEDSYWDEEDEFIDETEVKEERSPFDLETVNGVLCDMDYDFTEKSPEPMSEIIPDEQWKAMSETDGTNSVLTDDEQDFIDETDEMYDALSDEEREFMDFIEGMYQELSEEEQEKVDNSIAGLFREMERMAELESKVKEFTRSSGLTKVEKQSKYMKSVDKFRDNYFYAEDNGKSYEWTMDSGYGDMEQCLMQLTVKELSDYCRYSGLAIADNVSKEQKAEALKNGLLERPELLCFYLFREELDFLIRLSKGLEEKDNPAFVNTCFKALTFGILEIVENKRTTKCVSAKLRWTADGKQVIELLSQSSWKRMQKRIRSYGDKVFQLIEVYGILSFDFVYEKTNELWKNDITKEECERVLYCQFNYNGDAKTLTSSIDGISYIVDRDLDIEKNVLDMYQFASDVEPYPYTLQQIQQSVSGFNMLHMCWSQMQFVLQNCTSLSMLEIKKVVDFSYMEARNGKTPAEILEGVTHLLGAEHHSLQFYLWDTLMTCCMNTGLPMLRGYTRKQIAEQKSVPVEIYHLFDESETANRVTKDTPVYKMPMYVQMDVYRTLEIEDLKEQIERLQEIERSVCPGNYELRFAQVTAYFDRGKYEEAKKIAKELKRELNGKDPYISSLYVELRNMEKEEDSKEADWLDTLFAPEGNVETYRRESAKIGRNDPCPCGSGKKYKKCCGR